MADFVKAARSDATVATPSDGRGAMADAVKATRSDVVRPGDAVSWTADRPASGRIAGILGVAFPVLYLWLLPALAEVGFANKCINYPRCQVVGLSVSNYIVTPQATGAMAAAFFYPCLFMWINALQVRDAWCLPTLAVFQFTFGLFMMCPVDKVPQLHFPMVLSFCLASMVHFHVLLKYCPGHRRRACRALIYVAFSCFVAVFALGGIGHVKSTLLPDHACWLFYVFECLGLSSNACYPILWYLEEESHERGRTVPADELQWSTGRTTGSARSAPPLLMTGPVDTF